MIKRPLLICFLFCLLLACQIPGISITTIPTVDDVATAVANTLTARPSVTPEVSIELSATPNPGSPIIQVASMTPSPSITSTPQSLKSTLGSPVWENHLDSGKSFGVSVNGFSDENIEITMTNGVMQLKGISYNGFRSWRLSSPVAKNLYLEAVFNVLTCNANDQYGLVFRAPDYSSGLGYYFGLSCDGNYSLYEWTSTGSSVVLSGNSQEIHKGNNQTNRLGIKAVNNQFIFYVNEKEIQNFTDSNLPDAGHIGVFISAYSGNLVVQLDDIAYWDVLP